MKKLVLKLTNKNRPLYILIAINSFFILAANMFPPLFALFVKDMGGNVLSSGSIWAVFAIVTGFITLGISFYGDRIQKPEYLVAGGYALRIIAWTGYFLSNAIWQLYALQIVLAIGEALGTPAFNAMYSENLKKGRYVKEWGLSSGLGSIMSGVAALFGGIIAFKFGFRFLFLTMISFSFLSFFALLFFWKKTQTVLEVETVEDMQFETIDK